MGRRLRVLFYGISHEHASGRLASLRRATDDFEIVAVVDDRGRNSARFIDPAWPIDLSGLEVIAEDAADGINDVDFVCIETANADLMEIAAKFAARGIPMLCDKPCGESMEPYATIVATCREKGIPFFLETPTNQQFAILENARMAELAKTVGFGFWETYDDTRTVVRFATSWSTTEEDLAVLREAL